MSSFDGWIRKGMDIVLMFLSLYFLILFVVVKFEVSVSREKQSLHIVRFHLSLYTFVCLGLFVTFNNKFVLVAGID